MTKSVKTGTYTMPARYSINIAPDGLTITDNTMRDSIMYKETSVDYRIVLPDGNTTTLNALLVEAGYYSLGDH